MKDFVPYNEALALKEFGFDEPCFAAYYKKFDNDIGMHKIATNHNFVALKVSAPTFSQAFRFFREKYSFCGWVQEHYFKGLVFYQYHISRETLLDVKSDIYEAHEQAELECVKKLIEIAKQKN